jgi:hypothetical protein
MGILLDKIKMGQALPPDTTSAQIPQYLPATIIPPMSHTHSFIHPSQMLYNLSNWQQCQRTTCRYTDILADSMWIKMTAHYIKKYDTALKIQHSTTDPITYQITLVIVPSLDI